MGESHVLAVELEPHRVHLHRVIGANGAQVSENGPVDQVAVAVGDRFAHKVSNFPWCRFIPGAAFASGQRCANHPHQLAPACFLAFFLSSAKPEKIGVTASITAVSPNTVAISCSQLVFSTRASVSDRSISGRENHHGSPATILSTTKEANASR